MATDDSTCWTLVEGAAAGHTTHREDFARRYKPVVEAYLLGRWGASLRKDEIDDTVQEVFLECFREGGALEKVDPEKGAGFRAFLFGVARNVALRAESRRSRSKEKQTPESVAIERVPSDETSASQAFDRAWAQAIVEEAGELHRLRAMEAGGDAMRRVELLRLRFTEGLPIREIAARQGVDAEVLHREYVNARREYRQALREVVSFHQPDGGHAIDRECARLVAYFQEL